MADKRRIAAWFWPDAQGQLRAAISGLMPEATGSTSAANAALEIKPVSGSNELVICHSTGCEMSTGDVAIHSCPLLSHLECPMWSSHPAKYEFGQWCLVGWQYN